MQDIWTLRSKWYTSVHTQYKSTTTSLLTCTCTSTSTTGRYCCLWCHIRQDQLIIPPSVRGAVIPRSTQSICDDHQKFVDAGSKLKSAKHFNNCISQPFFTNFPLTQVNTTQLCAYITTSDFFLAGLSSWPTHHSRHLHASLCPVRECLS